MNKLERCPGGEMELQAEATQMEGSAAGDFREARVFR